MTKGTPAKGKFSSGKTHIVCRRCGRRSYHVSRNICASCGYGKTAKLRKYSWQKNRKK